MGCSPSSPANGAGPGGTGSDGVAPGDVPLRMSNGSSKDGRRLSQPTADQAPELQSRLEKLDEERLRLHEDLRRIQSAAALEQDGDVTDGNGEKPRVRFSKFDNASAHEAPQALPQNAAAPSRRTSSTSAMAMGGLGRLSSYQNKDPAVASTDRMLIQPPGGRSDIKLLAEMVNRGRRRTRYTHRPTGSEQGSRATPLSPSPSNSETKIHYLPRGGVHVTTKYGAVQFGLPPETIKDAMQLGLEVRLRRSRPTCRRAPALPLPRCSHRSHACHPPQHGSSPQHGTSPQRGRAGGGQAAESTAMRV